MRFALLALAVAVAGACTPSDQGTEAAAQRAAEAAVVADQVADNYHAAYEPTPADAAEAADAAAAEAAATANIAAANLGWDRAAAAPTTGTPERFSKRSFDAFVIGMTKRELRQRFGSPDTVHSDGDWTYFNLPVFDDEAGIKARWVDIQFAGVGGMDDQIAAVSY